MCSGGCSRPLTSAGSAPPGKKVGRGGRGGRGGSGGEQVDETRGRGLGLSVQLPPLRLHHRTSTQPLLQSPEGIAFQGLQGAACTCMPWHDRVHCMAHGHCYSAMPQGYCCRTLFPTCLGYLARQNGVVWLCCHAIKF